jgi:AraC family transcriptional regulator, positive regulator of tynA and feaB
MKRIFSTLNVHPRDRFDFWHSIACATIVGHDSIPAQRNLFSADIDVGVLAEIGVVRFENSPMRVSRTAAQVAQACSDELFVCRQDSGSLSINQDGHAVILRAGELSLLDPLMPYAADFPEQSQTLVLKIPRRSLEARLGPSRPLIGKSFGLATPFQKWVSSFLATLPGVVEKLGQPAEMILQTQIMDLIALSLAEAGAASKPRISSARSVALLAVRAAIEARLTHPSLNSSMAANAAGVSVRYANALLATDGESIMSLILARRLDRCLAALEDRKQDHLTISDIALSWGFSDMTHFGRSFKAKYKILPSELRKLSKMR